MPDFDHNKILYKYRGFGNLEFALDIFLNERLYAADFKSLNDPMEGRFRYSRHIKDRERIKETIIDKSDFRILSLSQDWNNHLLWSYYSEGHSGFVVGVKIKEGQNLTIREVDYVPNFFLRENEINPENILSRKHETWDHENEVRVLQHNYNESPFVDVEIKQLIFGRNSESQNKLKVDLLKRLVEKTFGDTVEIITTTHNNVKEWVDGNS